MEGFRSEGAHGPSPTGSGGVERGGFLSGVYFQSAHLLSALVVNTWSPGSFLMSL